ncbi:nipped B protein delangin scc2 [Echinococcus multilocularis]|uniref:Nipped-B protein n=1 Tax=Echinococcus multilocularis TaxID=6211 RepID=A0A068YA34_ECHMU|nr:nipped B protein delangin scc2 [Echinococcus multilocularis]
MTSPMKSGFPSATRHQTLGSPVAPVKLTLKQSQTPGSGSIYSVTSVEPLKLSIKRAPATSTPVTVTQGGLKKLRVKRRSKASTISSNQKWPMQLAELGSAPVVPTQSQIVHSHSVQSTRLPAPNPSPSLQLVISAPSSTLPPPPPKDPPARNSGQMLSTVFNQLLQSDPESTIASLLSSSDGQSTGNPASVEPHHPRSPPLSVPSNCSYPATPGMNSSLSLNNNNSSTSNVAPVAVTSTTNPSPINTIFDTADVSDGRETNPTPAPPPPPPPRGLAAYLQKSRNPEMAASPSEDVVDAYARQHGSVPPMSSLSSSPWTERRCGPQATSNANIGAAVYPTSSSLTGTPNGQEGGKEKRGRRRRSELEELINWQVRDQATPLKRHAFQSQQIPPIIENSPPPPRAPSDNEGVAFFTEPLGERVKRRRQQHTTPLCSSNSTSDVTRNTSGSKSGDGNGGKSGVTKRSREGTSSELSVSPKRGKTLNHRHHRLTSSESEIPDDDEEEEAKGVDDGATSSSCLTDSPVPRKHSLQRLVEEAKGRPPSLSRLDSLRHTPVSSTPIPLDETVSPLARLNSNRLSPSMERPRKRASTRSSTSPPPLLPLQTCGQDLVDRKERHRLKKRRQLIQATSSSEDEFSKKSSHPMVIAERNSKRSSSHNRSAEMSTSRAHVSCKKQKGPLICSSSSPSSSSSSNACRLSPASFSKGHRKTNSDARSCSSEERRKPIPQRCESTSGTEPCTESSAMDYDRYEKDELSSLKALSATAVAGGVASSRLSPSSSNIAASSDLSDSDRTEMVMEAEKRIAEEVAKFAATWTHFSAHISEFLLRVGGLDLSKTAGDMCIAAVDPGEDFSSVVDQTPVEARLSRREVNALYHEAEEARVSGFISNEPNGRLVRFLNLLRVNIRDASSLMAPNPTVANFKELIQRRKARIERRNGGTEGNSGSSELLSESLLWSHPVWMRILRGLDSALIALHIIAGPDVPRSRLLAMEELVEAITAITHFHFNRLVTVICTPDESKRSGSNIPVGLTNLVRESLGSRLSEALCGLASLVRLHPGRFTDSLIMHLTDLAILVISCGLSPGTSRRSPPPGTTASSSPPSTILFPETAPHPVPGESLERRERRQKEYYERNAWRLQMQRSALALASIIFLQYDKHRRLVASDVLSNLITAPIKAVSNKTSISSFARSCSAMRNFWILASGSFTKGWQPFCRNAQTSSSSAHNFVANSHFLRVHPFTAVLMALIQGLIPAPSHMAGGRRSSSAGAPATPSSGVSQQSTTTGTGMSDQHANIDATQLAKEEKSMCSAYTNAIRTSQFLISEMFRKAVAKGEDNLSPLVDTVLIDLLRVAADAPIEWPVASLLLTIFGKFLIQQLNGSSTTPSSSRSQTPTQGAAASATASSSTTTSASNRNADSMARQIALDSLITLTGGMYYLQKLRGSVNKSNFDLGEARRALSTFLGSPILGLYHLTLGIADESKADAASALAGGLPNHARQRDFAYQLISRLRYNHFDGLTVAAKRFHLVTWLHETNQELSSTTPSSTEERRKQLEEIRKGLLMEFASTHHSISGIAPWLPPTRGAGSGGGGGGATSNRAGLISPAASEPSIAGERPLSDTKLALYTGYGVGADIRHKKTARAHRFATKIAAHIYNPIGFDVLYMQIVKMVHDASLVVRTRALKGLSNLVETYPECIPAPVITESPTPSPSDLLSIVPLRLMDGSPMVREAAVELAGHLVNIPDSAFPSRLFKPLVNRVLDMQLSVRKRAAKSLQQILLSNCDDTLRTPLLTSKQRSDACVTLLRRFNDEDAIKKIVMETFTALWFTFGTGEDVDASKLAVRLEKRARNMCEVVLSVRGRGSGVVEEFMASILNQESPEKAVQVDAASSEIVDFLLKIVQRYHNASWHTASCPLHPKHNRGRPCSPEAHCKCSTQPPDVLSMQNVCLVLSIMAKPRPQLFLQHIPILAEVVGFAAVSQDNGGVLDGNTLSYAIEIIESCCRHAAAERGSRLSQLFPDGTDALEDYLIVLLQRHCRVVVDSSVACLAAIAAQLTMNYSRVATCFAQFYECLIQERKAATERLRRLTSKHTAFASPSSSSSVSSLRSPLKARPKVLRAVYAVGLICKHFSLEDLANAAVKLSNESNTGARRSSIGLSILTHQANIGTNNRDEVFNTLMFFSETALLMNIDEEARRALTTTSNEDVEMAKKAVAGLSFLANRHDYLFRSPRLQEFFKSILSGVSATFPQQAVADLQCIVLDCINAFLIDEEKTMLSNDSNWLARRKQESLKDLGDSQEVHGGTVAQIYLKTALEHCIICPSTTVRTKALSLVATAARQGLVHPVSFIAPLISLQTDPDFAVRSRAISILQEISQRYSGFLALKAAQGIRSGFLLQRMIASSLNKQQTIIRGAYVGKAAATSTSSCPDKTDVSSAQARPLALSHPTYSLLQGNKQHRRSLITSLVNLFDMDYIPQPASQAISPYISMAPDVAVRKSAFTLGATETDVVDATSEDNGLSELIYVCDHLAHFPYKTVDEVYYLAHYLDLRISTIGSALVRSLQDCLVSTSQLKAESSAVSTDVDAATEPPSLIYDRKVINLLEDVESELFAKPDMPLEVGLNERKAIDRINRPVAAVKRLAFREKVFRNGPACLLLMAIRKYLEEAYDVTSNKLSSYSSTDEKHLQKPIPSPSARTLHSGVLYQLVEIPAIVTSCALNPAWPVVSPSLKEALVRDSGAGDAANLDINVLRVALLVHRQLLTVDGSDEALGMEIAPPPSPLLPPMPRPSIGPNGDVVQSKRAAAAIPTHRETERFREKSHSDHRISTKIPTKSGHSSSTKHRRVGENVSEDRTGNLSDSLSSLSDTSSVRKMAGGTKQQSAFMRSTEKKKRRQPSCSPSIKPSKHLNKSNPEETSTLSKHNITSASMPKKDTTTKSSSRKRQHNLSDTELSSLSSLEEDPALPRKPAKRPPQPSPSFTKKAVAAATTSASAERPVFSRPKYDLAPLPGTPDILTQQEQRRRMKALAAKKAVAKHLLMETAKKKSQPAQPSARSGSFKREASSQSELSRVHIDPDS